MERYNRTIKELLKNINEKNGDKFNLKQEINNAIIIYNKTQHSTICFSPETIFN